MNKENKGFEKYSALLLLSAGVEKIYLNDDILEDEINLQMDIIRWNSENDTPDKFACSMQANKIHSENPDFRNRFLSDVIGGMFIHPLDRVKTTISNCNDEERVDFCVAEINERLINLKIENQVDIVSTWFGHEDEYNDYWDIEVFGLELNPNTVDIINSIVKKYDFIIGMTRDCCGCPYRSKCGLE